MADDLLIGVCLEGIGKLIQFLFRAIISILMTPVLQFLKLANIDIDSETECGIFAHLWRLLLLSVSAYITLILYLIIPIGLTVALAVAGLNAFALTIGISLTVLCLIGLSENTRLWFNEEYPVFTTIIVGCSAPFEFVLILFVFALDLFVAWNPMMWGAASERLRSKYSRWDAIIIPIKFGIIGLVALLHIPLVLVVLITVYRFPAVKEACHDIQTDTEEKFSSIWIQFLMVFLDFLGFIMGLFGCITLYRIPAYIRQYNYVNGLALGFANLFGAFLDIIALPFHILCFVFLWRIPSHISLLKENFPKDPKANVLEDFQAFRFDTLITLVYGIMDIITALCLIIIVPTYYRYPSYRNAVRDMNPTDRAFFALFTVLNLIIDIPIHLLFLFNSLVGLPIFFRTPHAFRFHILRQKYDIETHQWIHDSSIEDFNGGWRMRQLTLTSILIGDIFTILFAIPVICTVYRIRFILPSGLSRNVAQAEYELSLSTKLPRIWIHRTMSQFFGIIADLPALFCLLIESICFWRLILVIRDFCKGGIKNQSNIEQGVSEISDFLEGQPEDSNSICLAPSPTAPEDPSVPTAPLAPTRQSPPSSSTPPGFEFKGKERTLFKPIVFYHASKVPWDIICVPLMILTLLFGIQVPRLIQKLKLGTYWHDAVISEFLWSILFIWMIPMFYLTTLSWRLPRMIRNFKFVCPPNTVIPQGKWAKIVTSSFLFWLMDIPTYIFCWPFARFLWRKGIYLETLELVQGEMQHIEDLHAADEAMEEVENQAMSHDYSTEEPPTIYDTGEVVDSITVCVPVEYDHEAGKRRALEAELAEYSLKHTSRWHIITWKTAWQLLVDIVYGLVFVIVMICPWRWIHCPYRLVGTAEDYVERRRILRRQMYATVLDLPIFACLIVNSICLWRSISWWKKIADDGLDPFLSFHVHVLQEFYQCLLDIFHLPLFVMTLWRMPVVVHAMFTNPDYDTAPTRRRLIWQQLWFTAKDIPMVPALIALLITGIRTKSTITIMKTETSNLHRSIHFILYIEFANLICDLFFAPFAILGLLSPLRIPTTLYLLFWTSQPYYKGSDKPRRIAMLTAPFLMILDYITLLFTLIVSISWRTIELWRSLTKAVSFKLLLFPKPDQKQYHPILFALYYFGKLMIDIAHFVLTLLIFIMIFGIKNWYLTVVKREELTDITESRCDSPTHNVEYEEHSETPITFSNFVAPIYTKWHYETLKAFFYSVERLPHLLLLPFKLLGYITYPFIHFVSKIHQHLIKFDENESRYSMTTGGRFSMIMSKWALENFDFWNAHRCGFVFFPCLYFLILEILTFIICDIIYRTLLFVFQCHRFSSLDLSKAESGPLAFFSGLLGIVIVFWNIVGVLAGYLLLALPGSISIYADLPFVVAVFLFPLVLSMGPLAAWTFGPFGTPSERELDFTLVSFSRAFAGIGHMISTTSFGLLVVFRFLLFLVLAAILTIWQSITIPLGLPIALLAVFDNCFTGLLASILLLIYLIAPTTLIGSAFSFLVFFGMLIVCRFIYRRYWKGENIASNIYTPYAALWSVFFDCDVECDWTYADFLFECDE